eukprot:366070-Chlamydomonas_euryale.AAC.9
MTCTSVCWPVGAVNWQASGTGPCSTNVNPGTGGGTGPFRFVGSVKLLYQVRVDLLQVRVGLFEAGAGVVPLPTRTLSCPPSHDCVLRERITAPKLPPIRPQTCPSPHSHPSLPLAPSSPPRRAPRADRRAAPARTQAAPTQPPFPSPPPPPTHTPSHPPFRADEHHELTVARRLTAGACAGMTATALTHPLDTVRLRLALPGHPYPSASGAFLAIARNEGLAALYKGLVPTLLGVAPYAALNFASYDMMKKAAYHGNK